MLLWSNGGALVMVLWSNGGGGSGAGSVTGRLQDGRASHASRVHPNLSLTIVYCMC